MYTSVRVRLAWRGWLIALRERPGWLSEQSHLSDTSLGLFGAGRGAAAAMVATDQSADLVKASGEGWGVLSRAP
jgi:hypothetical protein